MTQYRKCDAAGSCGKDTSSVEESDGEQRNSAIECRDGDLEMGEGVDTKIAIAIAIVVMGRMKET